MLEPYDITFPRMRSEPIYYFTTDSGVKYEVRFGRKKSDLLSVSVVFGVINEEFEGEEYVTTNRGEVYRVMATIITIVQNFLKENPVVHALEFTGESVGKEMELNQRPNVRTKLYLRYVDRFLDDDWEVRVKGSRVRIYKPDAF